ncbi:MAG: lysine--tRNA ligase [Spirochaetales bacterium]|nr:lysine--tRNA ligase [Spirochaetales bacterium]
MSKAVHWADTIAEKIIREKGEKDQYVCASGITPSGTVHIGNFREIISVELVARALRRLGKNVRFIYSWDDYDAFRKVPGNMPNPEELKKFLRFPITKVPDPHGKEESYAHANEKRLEQVMDVVGIHPEYIYQSRMYGESKYAEGIRKALENVESIRSYLDMHRSTPLPADWTPVSIFCSLCHRDLTAFEEWDGGWNIEYSCEGCGNRETIDLRKASGAKLLWRVDWPMRWAYEGVDFEPAGKEHHSAGGSFDTAKVISKPVYGFDPPVTFKYDFISIKGMGGKISSSIGNVLSVADVLEIYQPELIRYLFAGTRPDSEFAISFDLDVIKIYEDYDRCERVYFGSDEIGEKKRPKERRIYELSQVDGVPEKLPTQLPFRHLCNLLQINDGDIEATLAVIAKTDGVDFSGNERDRAELRARCAWNWITNHAPEDFRFSLRGLDDGLTSISDDEKSLLAELRSELERDFEGHTEESLGTFFYTLAEKFGLQAKDLYRMMYRVLLGKDRGPRLAGFILTAGSAKVLPILERYR